MEALQEGEEDSRTASVGRKRDIETSFHLEDQETDPSDDMAQPSKRFKKESSGNEPSHDQVTRKISPTSLIGLPPTEITQIPLPQATSWNKGVQSGLRTSFGPRNHTPPAAYAAPLTEEDGIASRDRMYMEAEATTIAGAPRSPVEAGPGLRNPLQQGTVDASKSVANVGHMREERIASNLSSKGEPNMKRPTEETLGSSQVQVSPQVVHLQTQEVVAEIPRQNNTTSDNDTAATKPFTKAGPSRLFPRALPLDMKRVYENANGVYDLHELLQNGEPICLEDLDLSLFVSHFLATNADKLPGLRSKHLKAAWNSYIFLYYTQASSPAGKALVDNARDRAASAQAKALYESSLALARAQTVKELKENRVPKIPKEPSKAQALVGGSLSRERTSGPEGDGQAALPEASVIRRESAPVSRNAIILDPCPASSSAEHTQESFLPVAKHGNPSEYNSQDGVFSVHSEREDGELSSPLNAEPEVELNDLELELLEKYFPSVSKGTAPKCLACADARHRTYNCPDLTCAVCGGGHSDLSCPQNRRCGKCREKGHQTPQCKEKLLPSKGEVLCDICNSQEHLETSCHFIWRSFKPQPEDIIKVRDIPIHCYICGFNGHYGPECGLRDADDRLLSGGLTWSRSNLLKYSDPTSSNRAIAAGPDYALAPRTKPSFSIKGRANDPINLDDSDDDGSFIRPKVLDSSTKHYHQQIRFTKNNGIASQEMFPRKYNQPREARPIFGNYVALNDVGRHARERTFSPPPRFGEYSVPQNDLHRPQGGRAIARGGQSAESGVTRGATRPGGPDRSKRRPKSSKINRQGKNR
jgi:hypothetical protein